MNSRVGPHRDAANWERNDNTECFAIRLVIMKMTMKLGEDNCVDKNVKVIAELTRS